MALDRKHRPQLCVLRRRTARVASVAGGQQRPRRNAGCVEDVSHAGSVVRVAFGAARGDDVGVDGVLGDGEDGVLVLVEVADAVVLEDDLLAVATCAALVIRIHSYVALVVDDLIGIVLVEHLGLGVVVDIILVGVGGRHLLAFVLLDWLVVTA